MLKDIKEFIRDNFFDESHPFLWSLWFTRMGHMVHKRCERHSRMSYAEIEAEISAQYENLFGRKLNWDKPQTYNEKIHVSKLYMPSELKTRLADKYLVREWIREKIGDEYLIPLLGVYDSFDEIDFDALPDRFVIKCNHDSTSVTFIRDKSKINKKLEKRKFDIYLRRNYAWLGLEMHYRDIKPKIIIEQYMGSSINDYKLMCFNGEPYYCWVDLDRSTRHTRNFYNLDWERQPFSLFYPDNHKDVECPSGFNEMKEVAGKLCKEFPHVRVDLYFIDGRIYFGEMTFASGSGFEKFTPDEWDYKLGELWPFDNTARKKILSEHSRP